MNPRRLAALILVTTAVSLWIAGAPPDRPQEPPAPSVPTPPVRGMTVSCQSWGWEWGSDEMVGTMALLKAMGVNWITIHPYAGIRADGRVVMSDRWYGDTRWVTRPIAEAHRLGLKIMIKPHLAYWGGPFAWRGEIAFSDDESWERFFLTYETWINRLAELSAGADAFVVGTELDRTVHHEKQWRRIIGGVRARLGEKVPLTYSANWDAFTNIPFWDALDVIGIQAYFPVAREPGLPAPEALATAWQAHLRRLDRFARRRDRKIVFAELGYSRSPRAAVEPWSGREGGEHADEIQRRCLTAALEAIEGSESIIGAFLWKWFPGETGRGNFLMSTPAMRRVIREQWGRSDPPEAGKLRDGVTE